MGLVVAGVLALSSLALINRLVYGPGGQVRAYFVALREGDGASALGILGAEIPEAGAALLDGDPLREASADVTDLRTESVDFGEGGDRATVTVAYQLAGEEERTSFDLRKVGSHWGVFDRWEIEAGALPVVRVSSGQVDAATLNGAKVSLGEGSREFAVLYPGRVTVSYESALYSSVSESVAVVAESGEPAEVAVELEPSEAVLASVQQQVRTYLDSCAAQNALYPEGCPFEFAFAGRVEGAVTWTVTDYPEPSVGVKRSGWSLGSDTGTAEISFTSLDLLTGQRSQVVREVPFKVAGSLKVEQDQVVFTPVAS